MYGFLSHRSPLQDQTDLISYSYFFPKNELCTWHYFSFNIIQVSFNVCHIFVSDWPCTLRWHYCISNLLLHCKFLDRNNKFYSLFCLVIFEDCLLYWPYCKGTFKAWQGNWDLHQSTCSKDYSTTCVHWPVWRFYRRACVSTLSSWLMFSWTLCICPFKQSTTRTKTFCFIKLVSYCF